MTKLINPDSVVPYLLVIVPVFTFLFHILCSAIGRYFWEGRIKKNFILKEKFFQLKAKNLLHQFYFLTGLIFLEIVLALAYIIIK